MNGANLSITLYTTLLEENVTGYHKQLLLESLHSTLDKNAINKRNEFPRPLSCHSYIPLGVLVNEFLSVPC